MKRNTELKTPWLRGHLMHHPYPNKGVEPDEWRDNNPFKLKLVMRGTERGRSAAYFRWEVQEGDLPEGTRMPMFITDVGHVIMQGLPKPGGVIEGEFFVVKRGQNYGITPVWPPDDVAPRGQERPTETTGAPAGT